MSSPEKKRRKKNVLSPTPQSSSIPSLPDDLLMTCVARVSRFYYPTLSLVSKRFRSLLASPELYKARSLQGHTESCLYVCLNSYSGTRWFTLCRKPNQTLTNDTKKKKKKKKKKSSEYVLARLPIPLSPHASSSGLVAVGSDIYNIGSRSSYYDRRSSSSVLVMDCRFHTWHEAPSMPVELTSHSASVVDGKIYVAGRHGDYLIMKNSCEVLDTKTQIWDPEPPVPCGEKICSFYNPRSACIDGKFHVETNKGIFGYISNEGRWYLAEPRMGRFMNSDSYCKIENVLYSSFLTTLEWYDTHVRLWKKVKGLVGLPKFHLGVNVKLAACGDKMAVLWDEDLPFSNQKMIWCAEIALKRRRNCEIWEKLSGWIMFLQLP